MALHPAFDFVLVAASGVPPGGLLDERDRIGDKRGGHVHKSAPVLAPETTVYATRISARLHAVEGELSRRQGWRRLAGLDRAWIGQFPGHVSASRCALEERLLPCSDAALTPPKRCEPRRRGRMDYDPVCVVVRDQIPRSAQERLQSPRVRRAASATPVR